MPVSGRININECGPEVAECQRTMTEQVDCIKERAFEALEGARHIKIRMYGVEPESQGVRCELKQQEGMEHQLDIIEDTVNMLLKTLYIISGRLYRS